MKCVAPGCNNSSDNNVKMCMFPKEDLRQNVWLQNSGLVDLPKCASLCEVFISEIDKLTFNYVAMS